MDRAWERAWMDDFHPMRFGDRLWVVPWGQTPPAAEAVNLRLDPGLAFGTGTHPTTALCLRWLDGLPLQADTRLVDYGCGSGILAVAGCLLGAGHCTAVDNDPQARQATADNARRNGVGERIRVRAPARCPGRGRMSWWPTSSPACWLPWRGVVAQCPAGRPYRPVWDPAGAGRPGAGVL